MWGKIIQVEKPLKPNLDPNRTMFYSSKVNLVLQQLLLVVEDKTTTFCKFCEFTCLKER